MVKYLQVNQCNTPHYKLKNKNPMTISIDAEKASDKIQHPFMIKKKKLSTKWVEREHTSVKAMYDKSTANIILNSETLKAFPLRLRIKQGHSLSPVLFNIVLEVLDTAVRLSHIYTTYPKKGLLYRCSL